jgi:hypothetical protein
VLAHGRLEDVAATRQSLRNCAGAIIAVDTDRRGT